MKRLLAVVVVGLSASALAEPPSEELIDRVVVRNRLFQVKSRLEASASFGIMPMPTLVEHYNLNGGLAYNLFETIALEVRGGYALSRHTGLANRISQNLLEKDPLGGAQREVDDLSGLWQMNFNAAAGVRWAPIYGKLSLMAELPVHFQFYLWAGGGMASLHRQSLVYCLAAERPAGGPAQCGQWLEEDRVTPMASGAVGLRFFVDQHSGLRLEARNYLFPDRYRTQINRVAAESGDAAQGTAADHGYTHLVLFDLGYTFVF